MEEVAGVVVWSLVAVVVSCDLSRSDLSGLDLSRLDWSGLGNVIIFPYSCNEPGCYIDSGLNTLRFYLR